MKQASKAIECRVAALLLIIFMGTALPAMGAITVTSDVFVGSGEGPLGTSNYRIPGMAVAPDGSILAFAEGRRNGTDPGQAGFPIDLVMKRSTNGGQTWDPLVVLEADAAFDYDDPTPVVDATTGNVHLIYGRVPDDCGLFCVPAGTGADSMNVWQMTSSDNGQNWSAPINLTSQVKDPSWKGIVPGPGSGIQLRWQDSAPSRNGRLVIPSSINANQNLIFYSDDSGANWQHSNLAQVDLSLGGSFNGNENEVVELTNGDLLMNARQSGGSSRRMFRSSDGGASWIESYNGLSPIARVDASMIRYSAVRDGDDRDRILFSGPLGTPVGAGNGRTNIGVWTSYDEGRTFINPVQLGSGHAAYSVLQKLNDDSVGLIYEATGSTLIRYVGFDINELERASHSATMSHYDGFGNAVDSFGGGVGWSGTWSNSGVTSNEGVLEFPGFFTTGDEQHVRLRGADMTRDLGSGAIDLNANQDYYFSLFVNHDSQDGVDAASNEWFDFRLLDGGSQQFSFGVVSDEAFFVRNENTGTNVLSSSDTLQTDTSYLLLAKLAAQDDSDGGNSDQLFLAWYDDPAQVPTDQSLINWQLASETSDNFAGVIDEIFIGGGASADWLVDGLRVGTTFDAVIVDTGVTPAPVLGDLNSDLMINLEDWLVFRGNMLLDTSALSLEGQLSEGDFDNSGLIGLEDFAAFVDLYDGANGAGAFAAAIQVPEPNSMLLLLLGGISLTSVRFRKCRPCYLKAGAVLLVASWLVFYQAGSVYAVFDGYQVDSSTFVNLYDGDEVYNGANFVNEWDVAGGSGAADYSLNGTNLIHTIDSNNGWIEHDNGSTPWELGSGSWTIETRAHVVATGDSGFVIWGALNGERNIMRVEETGVSHHGITTYDSSDNTDGFHTFRLAYDATSDAYHYFRDGLQITPLAGIDQQSTTSEDRLIFGDCCSGFAGSGSIVEYEYFRYDNSGAFSPTAASELTLQINTSTGAATIVNDGSPIDFDVNSYLIASEGDSLLKSDWNSLQAQDVASDPTPGNTDNGDSWEEYDGADSGFLGEAFLLGTTTLDDGNTFLLGEIFDVNKPRDLKFSFSSAQEGVLQGVVEYVVGPVDADFDDDDDVDGADFLTWQRGFGAAGTNATGDADSSLFVDDLDLVAWRNQFGTNSTALLGAASVPEPNSTVLLSIGTLIIMRIRRLHGE